GPPSTTSRTAPTRTISVAGTPFAYRELGPRTGVPLVFLHHFTAVLDDWDPRVLEGIAAQRHVIAFDHRGVGASGGSVPPLRDPRHYLFFNRNPVGKRAATDYMARLKERTADRDKRISMQARLAQLKAIREAGLGTPHDLGKIRQPVFVANGDNDVMVASSHSVDLARRIPNAQLTIYPDSGHGGVFQYHREFVPAVLEFLES